MVIPDSMGDGSRPKRQYFKAICSECGQECEVPFRPTQGKTVCCNECFKKHAPPRDDRRRRF
jgi:CxxC-x17-CxxC domain-containing protein